MRYLDSFLVWHINVDGQMSEGLGQGSSGTLHGDNPALHAHVHALTEILVEI